MRRAGLVALTVGVVVVLAACGRYAPRFLPGDAPSASQLVGVWTAGDSSLSLESDGTAVLRAVPEGFLLTVNTTGFPPAGFDAGSTPPIDATATWEEPSDDGWWELHFLPLRMDRSDLLARVVIDPGGWGRDIRLCFEHGDPDSPDTLCLEREDSP